MSRVVRRKVGEVAIPIVAPCTGLPRALVLEVVPEHRLVVAVEVVPGEVVETVVPQLIARSEQVSQRRAGGVAATGGLDGSRERGCGGYPADG